MDPHRMMFYCRHDFWPKWPRAVRGVTAAMVGLLLSACSSSAPPPGTSYQALVMADRAVGFWRLADPPGEIAHDETANGNQGKVGAGLTLRQPGPSASSFSTRFDGAKGDITVPDSPSLRINNGSLTLEAWIKPDIVQPGVAAVLAKGTAGVHTEYGLLLEDGILAYQSVAERYVSSAPPLPQGAWSHVAVTVARNLEGVFYVNGVSVATFTSNTGRAITSSTQPVTIGNIAAANNRFQGLIAEAAIYPHALTPEQIQRHAEAVTRND